MPLPAGIEREVGQPSPPSVGGFLETFEDTAELRWPMSTIVFDRMRRSDGQVASILRAINLPVLQTGRRLAGDDVDPDVIRWLELELGLAPKLEGRRRRRREGIVFGELLRHALLMLPFGHSPLEQVYEVGPPPPGLEGRLPARMAHLRKLGPRLPRTLTGLDVAGDGGLEAIRQQIRTAEGQYREVRIPVDRLVMFCHEREGGDWSGTSILRSAYKHWLLKDVLLRLGPLAVERNGMGIPVVYYGEGGDRDEALRIAREVRAGEDAGAALPDSYRFELMGVQGTTRDELPLLKYHDESIGRAVLAMFLNLGHDNGARSLGDTFVDYFVMSIGAVLENIAETITEHVIRDLVELNLGPDEPYPELVFDDVTADGHLAAEALGTLVDSGVITPDDDLEAEVRRRHKLPPMGTARQQPAEVLPDGRQLTPGGPVDPLELPAGPAAVDDVDVVDLQRRAAAVSARLAALSAGS